MGSSPTAPTVKAEPTAGAGPEERPDELEGHDDDLFFDQVFNEFQEDLAHLLGEFSQCFIGKTEGDVLAEVPEGLLHRLRPSQHADHALTHGI